jgi:glutathione synthase/RimK-type ligase-like ATP-grasp enzyme
MESKKEIYDLMPKEYYPPTIFFKAGTDTATILQIVRQRNFSFPVVGKPDIGQKGLSVKKLEDENDLIEYSVDFLVQ